MRPSRTLFWDVFAAWLDLASSTRCREAEAFDLSSCTRACISFRIVSKVVIILPPNVPWIVAPQLSSPAEDPPSEP